MIDLEDGLLDSSIEAAAILGVVVLGLHGAGYCGKGHAQQAQGGSDLIGVGLRVEGFDEAIKCTIIAG